jgi:hypothetical protein
MGSSGSSARTALALNELASPSLIRNVLLSRPSGTRSCPPGSEYFPRRLNPKSTPIALRNYWSIITVTERKRCSP